MVLALLPIGRFVLLVVLVQSVSLYKIYALDDDDRSDPSRSSLVSPYQDDLDQLLSVKTNGDDDESIIDESKENLVPWLPVASYANQDQQRRSVWKRSAFPLKTRSLKLLPQRRNNRPHWNPLVAAYKRCGDLSARDERESCFKNAIQMLFVHKLKK